MLRQLAKPFARSRHYLWLRLLATRCTPMFGGPHLYPAWVAASTISLSPTTTPVLPDLICFAPRTRPLTLTKHLRHGCTLSMGCTSNGCIPIVAVTIPALKLPLSCNRMALSAAPTHIHPPTPTDLHSH